MMEKNKQEDKENMKKEEKIEKKEEIKEKIVEHEAEEKEKPGEKKKTEGSKKEEGKKKYEVVIRGFSMPISKKHGMYICKLIKNKTIDDAMRGLREVIEFKRAVPFKGEIPHRKGMERGRYPIKASANLINLLKALRGNANSAGLELEKTMITTAITNWASRPARSGGRKAKRANVVIMAKEMR